jgi:tellurite resistance protein
MSLSNLVPEPLDISAAHADVLLELCYLTSAVDGRLDDEEIASFQEIVTRLRGSAKPAEMDALFERFGGNVEHAEIEARIRTIAATLPKPLADVAFKLAVGLSVADLDASEDESDLLVTLAEAFAFDDEKVETLTAEVYASLDAGEDE